MLYLVVERDEGETIIGCFKENYLNYILNGVIKNKAVSKIF